MRLSDPEQRIPTDVLERLIEFGQALASTRETPALLDVIAYAVRLEWIVDELVSLGNIERGVTAQASTLAAPSPARGMSRRGRRPEQSQRGEAWLRLESFPLGELLEQVGAEGAQAARARRIGVQLEAPVGPLTLRADREKIRLALAHLLDNALKFSPEEDEVRPGPWPAHRPDAGGNPRQANSSPPRFPLL